MITCKTRSRQHRQHRAAGQRTVTARWHRPSMFDDGRYCRFRLTLRSYHPRLLDFFVHFAGHAAAALGVPLSKPVHLPTQRRLWTVIKGPFVHKKSQENFERKTHKRLLKAWDTHPEVVNMLVQYLEKHLAPGVGMRTVKWERAPVGVGVTALQAGMPARRADTQVEKVKALGEKIVQQEMASAAGAAKTDAVAKVEVQAGAGVGAEASVASEKPAS